MKNTNEFYNLSLKRDKLLLVSCSAISKYLKKILKEIIPNYKEAIDILILSHNYHIAPEKLTICLENIIIKNKSSYDKIFLCYGECVPKINELSKKYGIKRLNYAHCFEMYLGKEKFRSLVDEEPGTFFVTLEIVKNFDSIIKSLGIDRHQNLKEIFFKNYRRIAYIDTGETNYKKDIKRISNYLGLPYIVVKADKTAILKPLKKILDGYLVDGNESQQQNECKGTEKSRG